MIFKLFYMAVTSWFNCFVLLFRKSHQFFNNIPVFICDVIIFAWIMA